MGGHYVWDSSKSWVSPSQHPVVTFSPCTFHLGVLIICGWHLHQYDLCPGLVDLALLWLAASAPFVSKKVRPSFELWFTPILCFGFYVTLVNSGSQFSSCSCGMAKPNPRASLCLTTSVCKGIILGVLEDSTGVAHEAACSQNCRGYSNGRAYSLYKPPSALKVLLLTWRTSLHLKTVGTVRSHTCCNDSSTFLSFFPVFYGTEEGEWDLAPPIFSFGPTKTDPHFPKEGAKGILTIISQDSGLVCKARVCDKIMIWISKGEFYLDLFSSAFHL